MLKSEHLIDAAIDAFDGGTKIVSLLPFVGWSGDRCENTTVHFERDSYHTGSTDELEKRIAEHEHGEGCTWTRKRLPVEFVWRQEFATREEARAAEHQIKGWSRAKKKALIAGDFDLLHILAGRSQLSRAPFVRLRTYGFETPKNDVGSSATRDLGCPGVIVL